MTAQSDFNKNSEKTMTYVDKYHVAYGHIVDEVKSRSINDIDIPQGCNQFFFFDMGADGKATNVDKFLVVDRLVGVDELAGSSAANDSVAQYILKQKSMGRLQDQSVAEYTVMYDSGPQKRYELVSPDVTVINRSKQVLQLPSVGAAKKASLSPKA